MTDEMLLSAVLKVRKRIEQIRARDESINEQNTKSALIDPVLLALGWDLGELEEVCREFRKKPKDNPVDYAFFLLRNPCLFVEAKALDSVLRDRKWIAQILGYATVVGVEWCVLTNGDEYRIYNSHATVDIDDKLFRVVRISDQAQEQYVLDTLGLLSKKKMGEKLIDGQWKAHFIDQRVKAILSRILDNEDGALARLIRKKEPGLSRTEIRASLERANFVVDFPIPTSPQPPRPHSSRREKPGTTKLPILGKAKSLKLDFWTAFNSYLAGLNKPINMRRASSDHWYDVTIGKSGVYISLTLRTPKKDIGGEIYIRSSKGLYRFLLTNKSGIEGITGPLEWEELPNKQASRIIARKQLDPTNRETWEECFQWYLETIFKFKRGIVPLIENYFSR